MITSGSLFTRDYLAEATRSDPAWVDASLEAINDRIGAVFAAFPTDRSPNETQTESDLIWPILRRLAGISR